MHSCWNRGGGMLGGFCSPPLLSICLRHNSCIRTFLELGLAALWEWLLIIISRWCIYTHFRFSLTMMSPLTRIHLVRILFLRQWVPAFDPFNKNIWVHCVNEVAYLQLPIYIKRINGQTMKNSYIRVRQISLNNMSV